MLLLQTLAPLFPPLCYSHYSMSSLQEALYIANAIEMVPGEVYVSMSYENGLGDVEIPKGVKRGVKYL